MATLKKGTKGKPVQKLQDTLNKHGAKLKVDGQFGSLTEAATIAFQKQKKLKPDGKVGANTGFALGLEKRPKSLDWPHSSMDALYYKIIEARKFNSNVVNDAITFLKAAQADVENVRKALTVKETKLANTEKYLQKLFSEHKQTYNDMERMRIECEKLANPVEIAALHKKAGGLLKGMQAAPDAWYNSMNLIGKVLEEIKAYSNGLKKIKRG